MVIYMVFYKIQLEIFFKNMLNSKSSPDDFVLEEKLSLLSTNTYNSALLTSDSKIDYSKYYVDFESVFDDHKMGKFQNNKNRRGFL
jgi:hypothetical protein